MARVFSTSFRIRLCAALLLLSANAFAGQPLLVISVDGLDHRYLRDCDRLGLKIPNLRRLMREGAWADGVVGVVPTVTWPSHTTLITGVAPHRHGILGNRRPAGEGGDYYWSASLLKVRTLWHAAREAGLKTAAITWPVTVDAAIHFNLPEYFHKRRGGAMDLESIESKATAGLVEKISRVYPSFAQQWMDDRTRTLATLYLLRHEKPDLILLHLVDHDAEAHEKGPFSREANAILEYTDELIGMMVDAAPQDMVIAVVSDHGFERTDRVAALAPVQGLESFGTLALARNAEAAAALRRADGAGREIPAAEVRKLAPQFGEVAAAFEPGEHLQFGLVKPGAPPATVHERGNHGFWPTRKDYRASFLIRGKGIGPARLPEIEMLSIASRFAEILGIRLSN